ncbi:glycosyltransferase family 2 protein [Leptolyngbya sp. NIES-2104]|uniref:glycosyltransferase family 2 protein n=1 Tax=Leptolyngbya sp. NIES-2104 TaxID=1552121 RepID=UPI0006EC4F0D|nr:glycosyltransferase family 2 protein [Leptolyngbya sp. NIES-2104]GAP97583.1 colanic acid biosynthesis glycosyl transferase WcaE [Leptolyngbya sp. NIES-2104]
MKVSIITVAYNAGATIRDTIESVLSQDYPDIEHIIIDGASKDNTAEIVRSYGERIAQYVSEPDRGMYDGMNKGIKLATGDVVAILNADDIYIDSTVISTIVQHFEQHQVDSVFGDLVYVKNDNPDKIVRYYSSASFHPGKFAYGWMPAHPTFVVRRWAFDRYGDFKTDYKIAADYELLIRFLAIHKLSYHYIPQVLVKMRTGGASTANLSSNWILNREIVRGCLENGIQTNMTKVLSKYFVKVFQLVARPA